MVVTQSKFPYAGLIWIMERICNSSGRYACYVVSRAHGQCYAALHFVIPETINTLDYGKGSYDIGVGNFATAGNVSFKTHDVLSENSVQTEIGDFNHQRLLVLVQGVENKNASAYVATEFATFDGPFESLQNFHRLNLFGKLLVDNGTGNVFEIRASHVDRKWDASGQIPQRLQPRRAVA